MWQKDKQVNVKISTRFYVSKTKCLMTLYKNLSSYLPNITAENQKTNYLIQKPGHDYIMLITNQIIHHTVQPKTKLKLCHLDLLSSQRQFFI